MRLDRKVVPPTANQLTAAHPHVSSWVTASAGAGKTQVLTDRALRLLLAGTRPAAILCLTYTKAAAAEMQLRVVERLARWATVPPAVVREEVHLLEGGAGFPDAERIAFARSLFARVLDAPGGLRIQTIHSFCESLLGRFPVESKIAAHFQVADERTAAEMMDAARDEILAHPTAAISAAMGVLAERLNENQFRELMLALRRDRPRFEAVFEGGLAPALARLRATLGVAEGETPAIIAASAARGADEPNLRRVVQAMIAGGGTNDVKYGTPIATWLRSEAETRAGAFAAYCSAFFTGEGEPRAKLITKSGLALAPDGDAVLRRELARLEAVLARIKAATVAENTAALLTFGETLLDRYEAAKERHALLDYDDLILKAGDLLANRAAAPWVLYKLDGGLDHILLDEAQDTSPEQWDVIAAIASEFFVGQGASVHPRTVFAVGDPKQSIYGFRRADPAAFAYWRDDFGRRVIDAELDWRPAELVQSFRSVQPVLSAVDKVFESDLARDGLLIGESTVRHLPTRTGDAGYVELWPTEKVPDTGSDAPSAWEPPRTQQRRRSASAILAERIAVTVAGWVGKELLPSKNRMIAAGDVMVLVQRRSAFVEELIRELKIRHVPVAGTDRMIITTQLPVMDLIALANFALLPDDDLNLAAALKGPFLGLSEQDLYDLAQPRSGSLWRELSRRAAERPVFRHAYDRLAALRARADYVPPHAFFAELLAQGGRRELLARLGPEANDPVDEFLARALDFERTHPPSLQGFLHWIEKGQAEVIRDLEAGRDEVRVMTVHGAKGLQAPIVFLPDTVRTPLARDEPILWDGTLPLWPHRKKNDDPVSARARDAGRAARAQEYHRLLYVAMTRAEDRLIVCGWETNKKREDGSWYNLIVQGLDRMTIPATEPTEGVRRWASPQSEPAQAADAVDAGVVAPAPAWLKRNAPTEPAKDSPLTPSRPSGEEPPAFSPLTATRGTGLRRGVLIHRLLQLLPGVAGAHQARAADRFLATNAGDFAADERAEMAGAALAVLQDPAFAAIFSARGQAEVPVVGKVGRIVLSGQIDRLVVSDTDVLIVDYKTHRPAPKAEDQVPEIYVRQMAAYRGAIQAIYPGRPVHCVLLWTDGPRLMRLSEQSLAAVALT